MSLQQTLSNQVKQAVFATYNIDINTIEFQTTRKEFAGDITIVIFPMLRFIKQNPVQIATTIGNYLVENLQNVKAFNVVKGFLNIEIDDHYYINFFNTIKNNNNYGFVNSKTDDNAIIVEYSSPNTNKPLHLGHIRNNLLGYSIAEILKASGKKVYKTQIINDRGIHICKSMLAWHKFGNAQTPQSTGIKGDKFVGNYYVKFNQQYKKEIQDLIASGKTQEEAKKQAPILLQAQEMLKKWESGDEQVVKLWKTMNAWVYKGFNTTYQNLGVDFDTLYYESNTYLLGKEFVAQGLHKGIFVQEDDQSVWCDLSKYGLDKKLVQRANGTAVYITQDIGTAIQRIKDFPDVAGMVYTVGNEQDYHFQALFLILKKLGFHWAKNLYHLSYGMVDLPSGKMKSREGTVVDADDLIDQMTATASEISQKLGKLDAYSYSEKQELYKTIGLGALKYYILKIDPKKRIVFNPQASIDFQGNTGPFIQYTYARIQSIIKKADSHYNPNSNATHKSLHVKEKQLIKQLQLFPEAVQNAATQHNPALIANYTYNLVKAFNSFYQNVSILGTHNLNHKIFRLQLSNKVGLTIKKACSLLGIQVPESM